VIRLTNSEAKQWRRCRRKWYLGTYRGLQKRGIEFDNPLSIGTRMHDTLQHYYVPGLERPDPMAHFEAGVEEDVSEHPAMEDDIRKEADLCRAMLEGYLQWLEEEGEDSDIRVVEPESEMEAPLVVADDGSGTVEATLLSKIDARVERVSDGKRGALEHKTVGGSFKEALPTLQVDTQLLTEHLVEYLHLLEHEGEGTRAEFILYNMLRKVKRTARAKPPFYERHEVTHTVEELRNHWKHVHRIATEIIATRAELDGGASHHELCPPNPTRDCRWECEFRDVCLPGRLDDGQDPEPMIQDFFEVGDPLARYRRAAGLPVEVAK